MIYLTNEDKEYIKEMPVPSEKQAQHVIDTWDRSYKNSQRQDIAILRHTWYKIYVKAIESHPQLLI